MNFDKPDRLNFLPQNGLSKAPGTLTENLTTAFDSLLFDSSAGSMSKAFTMLEIWEPIVNELKENGAEFMNPGVWLSDWMLPTSVYDGRIDDIYSYIQENQDSLPQNLKEINAEKIQELTDAFLADKEFQLAEMSRTSPGIGPAIARFAGGMGGTFADPVTTATAPFALVGAGLTLTKNVLLNAAINTVAGAASEMSVEQWYRERGKQYTAGDFATNVSMGAAFGAALPLGGAAIVGTIRQARRGINFLKSRPNLSDDDKALIDILEDQLDLEESNPLEAPDPNAAQFEHESRLEAATIAINTNTAPNMPNEPTSAIKVTEPLQDELNALDKKWEANNAKLKTAEAEGLEIQNRLNDAYDADANLTKDSKIVKDLISENSLNQLKVDELRSIQDNLGGQRLSILEKQKQSADAGTTEAQDVDTIYRVEAKNIEVDAKTFQFKSGGDEFGVTARLQGITKWEPQWAGVVTVYEYADGRMAIADGHQRVGLAKRIMANDPSQNIKLNAYKLRQADGISVEQARMIAALTNIVEGSGTAVDAAKVLRVDPSRLPDLPPMSELVQQARGIMPLSDNSFSMVVNGIVPPKYAMYVGRLIEDKSLQDAAMRVLAKSTPESKFQAEAMVRQVRDLPSDQVKQIDLFGEEFMTESYVFERGKILSKAYAELRRDKAAFETLVRNSERLEAEGNVLVTEANQRKATTDAQTIALLQTLANRKGPLSDALNEAARTARDTNDYGPATSGFIGAVRRSIDAGDFESVSNSDIGRFVDGSPEVSRPEVKEPDLDGFDEPTGVAGDQQTDQLMVDMFGADQIADTPAAVAPENLAMQSALQQAQDEIQSDWRPYMFMEDGDTLVDINSVLPVKVRPEGVVKSLGFMVQSANNEIPKRGSLLLRDNGDGTFSIRDGNSTYSIAKAAGWSELPGKIIDDAQYASELSRKAADRILNQDALGKNKMRYVVAETLGKHEALIFVERLLERQRFKTGLGLFRKAKKNNETLNKAAAQAAADLGIEFEPADVKKLKRIEEKVRDKYQGKYNRLTDAARTGINAATMEEADAFVKALSKKFHLVDEGWKLTPAGYFDRKLMVIFDDKSLGEIQIWPPGMLKAKRNPTLFEKSGHDYYEISRSVDSTDVEIADANQKMIEIYGAVTSTLDQSFAQKLGTGAPSAKSVDSTLSSEISSEPSSVTTARASSLEPPTGIQPSSLSQSMPSGPSMAAIEPKSNLNNFMDDTSDFNLDIASANVNPDFVVPVGQKLNPDTNEVEIVSLSLRDLKGLMDEEDAMVRRLDFCTIGGNAK